MPEDSASRFSQRPRGRRTAAHRVRIAIPSADEAQRRGRSPTLGAAALAVAEPRRDLQLQAKPIIGRDQELAVARQRLLSPDVRLLTVTGPPGVGKTRLALQLASDVRGHFADGVCFVDLASIVDADLVIDAIARGLGLKNVDRRVVAHVVEQYLRGRALLVLLDNFEQVLDAADVVGRLLGACPGLKVLATSRAPLHIVWERELPVPPLGLPTLAGEPTATAVGASAAVQLFIERARTVAPEFAIRDADAAAVAEICVRLDGLPLAIELAAARIKLLPPRALLRRLFPGEAAEPSQGSALRLLADAARDLPWRHSTLGRAIAWSYDLLEPREQAVFRRLSVFVGGCSIEAAEAVGNFDMPDGLEIIASLVDKNLVWMEEQDDGEPRLRMLETIGDYAREQLAASGEYEGVAERHAAFYAELVEQAANELAGPNQQTWFTRFERDRANLEAVERWAIGRRNWDIIIRLWATLWPLWLARDDASQARERLETILPLIDQIPPGSTLVRVLHGAGLTAEKLGEYATCRSLLERAVAHARALEDRLTLAAVLDSLGRQEFIAGRLAQARPLLEESHAILVQTDDATGLARVLSHLGFLRYLEHRPAEARAIFERGLVIARAIDDRHRVAEFMDNLGRTSEFEGDLESAASRFEQAIAIWRELGQGHWLSMALNNLGRVEVRRGDLSRARAHLLEALRLAHRLGNRRRIAYTLAAVSELLAAEGRNELAVMLDATVAATVAKIGAALPRRAAEQVIQTVPGGPIMSLERAVEHTLALLATAVAAGPGGDTMPSAPRAVPLTRREREVVALVTQGLTNRQIAETLVLTEGTVENYVQRTLGKLGFNNRAQIAAWAVEHGFGLSRAT